jgi:hypothetical protein
MTIFKSRLIVGANSRVVKSLKLNPCIHLISHNDLSSTDLGKYEEIFLFSWSAKSNEDNICMIDLIPSSKLIFVSTIAIFANQYRNQWARYPNFKLICEEMVLAKKARILRIASLDDATLDGLQSDYAFTGPSLLERFLNECSWPNNESIVNLFTIKPIRRTKNMVVVMLGRVNELLPGNWFFQIPFILLSKLLGSMNYGYTYDCHRYTTDEVMIGYGALGSAYDASHPLQTRKYIVSFLPNKFLKFFGFVNTLVGKRGIGLSRYWHGVLTEQIQGSSLVKKDVFFRVPRPQPRRAKTANCEVLSIKYNGSLWCIQSITKGGKIVHDFANRIVLAAGPFENIRLISGARSISCWLDDDENAFVGSISMDECLRLSLVKKFGPFVYQPKGIRLRDDFFIEIRPPLADHKFLSHGADLFYVNTPFAIVIKIIKNFSFARFNEAFFNKFGFAFITNKFSVFCQVLKKNAIEISCESSEIKSLKRHRLTPSEWKNIQITIEEMLPSFEPFDSILSFDGLHIQGGWNQDVIDATKNILGTSILILGSPRNGRSDPFHTTRPLQAEMDSTSFK